MNLNGTCYDYGVMLTLATTMMIMIEGGLTGVKTEIDTSWMESFALMITIDLNEFEFPI